MRARARVRCGARMRALWVPALRMQAAVTRCRARHSRSFFSSRTRAAAASSSAAAAAAAAAAASGADEAAAGLGGQPYITLCSLLSPAC